MRIDALNPEVDEGDDTRRTRRRRRATTPDDGRVSLNIDGLADNTEHLLEFVDRLFEHESFEEPKLSSESRDVSGVRFRLEVKYLPYLTAESGDVQMTSADAPVSGSEVGAGETSLAAAPSGSDGDPVGRRGFDAPNVDLGGQTGAAPGVVAGVQPGDRASQANDSSSQPSGATSSASAGLPSDRAAPPDRTTPRSTRPTPRGTLTAPVRRDPAPSAVPSTRSGSSTRTPRVVPGTTQRSNPRASTPFIPAPVPRQPNASGPPGR